MIFHLPPALPPAGVMYAGLVEVATSSEDCKPGSRDCFPRDLVGQASKPVTVLAVTVLAPEAMNLAVARLFPLGGAA
jgi:hypothetical protein